MQTAVVYFFAENENKLQAMQFFCNTALLLQKFQEMTNRIAVYQAAFSAIAACHCRNTYPSKAVYQHAFCLTI